MVQKKISKNSASNEVISFDDTQSDSDFLTCPSCRVVNSIENDKCQTCGSQLIIIDQNQVSAA